jgi:hypothetical protein
MIFRALMAIEARPQTLKPLPATNAPAANAPPQRFVALTVLKGTSLQIALDSEVRVKKAGQTTQGHLMQPVYAFDQLVLPLGTRVLGHISHGWGVFRSLLPDDCSIALISNQRGGTRTCFPTCVHLP